MKDRHGGDADLFSYGLIRSVVYGKEQIAKYDESLLLLTFKNKVNSTKKAKTCPQIIEPNRFFHVEKSERDKHRERDDLLQYFKLGEGKG